MPTLSDVIAGAVRAERARRRWSQAELAERTGMARSTIGDIEQGKRQVTANHLPLFCRALGVPLEVLIAGAEPADVEAMKSGRCPAPSAAFSAAWLTMSGYFHAEGPVPAG